MNSKILRLIFIPLLLAIVMLAATFLQHAPSTAQALPPRPTAVPITVATGALIQLEVDGAVGNEWAMVQWQHPDTAVWHDIAGWQSRLDGNMRQAWWVGSEHFGSGPYRWQLYDEEGGNVVATSDLFTMPEQVNQILRISITVSE